MPKFYKQENGILIPPKDKSKFHISWNLNNIIEGFKYYYHENKRWPSHLDINQCPYLPNVKTLERKFGGITTIRKLLGLKETDYSKGIVRSEIAKKIGRRGYELEEKVYKMLCNRFHEPFVHYQSRVKMNGYLSINVDFIVFHSAGKFAIDVFYPEGDKKHFSNNVSIKYRIYKNFPYILYLCIGNEKISEIMIQVNINSSKNLRNSYVRLISFKNFLNEIINYVPLNNPYYS